MKIGFYGGLVALLTPVFMPILHSLPPTFNLYTELVSIYQTKNIF